MTIFKQIKIRVLPFLLFLAALLVFEKEATGQTNCDSGNVTETLNLSATPSNLQVKKTYKKTSKLFYTLPDGKTIADYNSYDNQHMEPVNRIERLVYAKDSSGLNLVLKHVLDPNVQFKPSIEPYELMVLYPTNVVIYNRFGNEIYSTDLDTASYSGGEGGEGGEGSPGGPGGGEPQIDSSQITITSIQGDSVFQIEGPNFITIVNKPKGIMVETVYDDYDLWIEKDIAFYDPENEDRSRPLLELNITRDTLPISGECVFRVISMAYEEYCSVEMDSSSSSRIIQEFNNDANLTMTKWPNPVSTFLNIMIKSDSPNERVQIEIINLEGRVMHSTQSFVNERFIIDVSEFVSGLYLIRAKTSSGLIVERVVIQN